MDHGTQQRTVRRGLPGPVIPLLLLAAFALPLAGAAAVILSHSAASPRGQSAERRTGTSLRHPCCNRKMPIRYDKARAGQSANGEAFSDPR
jgi:hypothetical protein